VKTILLELDLNISVTRFSVKTVVMFCFKLSLVKEFMQSLLFSLNDFVRICDQSHCH
jgi:hypothetical protein